MSGSFILVAMLAVCLALASADPVHKSEHQTPENVTMRARKLVSDVRDVVVQAKSGMYLGLLRQNVLDLQTAASDLINLLPEEVSECETQFAIKMAAAGTGSHEVLTVLLANDELGILNGRLSLALAFLDHVAGQLEDELSLTSDVGPHLTAIVFGTNVTLDIIGTADKTVKAMAATTHDGNDNNNNNNSGNNRVRRQIQTQFPVGRGWSVGTRGYSGIVRMAVTLLMHGPLSEVSVLMASGLPSQFGFKTKLLPPAFGFKTKSLTPSFDFRTKLNISFV